MQLRQVIPQARRLQSAAFILVACLLLTNILPGLAAPAAPQSTELVTISLPGGALGVAPGFEAAPLTAGNPKLDTAMTDLATGGPIIARRSTQSEDTSDIRLSGQRVHAQVVTHPGEAGPVTAAIAQSGGEVTGRSLDGTVLQGWLPVSALETLALHQGVAYIRQPPRPILLESPSMGNYTTEGLSVINGSAWHAVGLTGTGVKVAVIDGGFKGYSSLLGTELPAAVTVKNFVDGENDAQVDGSSVHGAACAEIIHDIAPGAELYLVKIETNIDLQEAVAWLEDSAQVDIISTSMGWFNLTPGDGSGEFASLVQGARQAGILWTTAAGNSRDQHWGGAFTDTDGDNIHNYTATQEVNVFGPGDGGAYVIPAGIQIRIYLRWDDWVAVNQDYDLRLLRWKSDTGTWKQVDASQNIQNGAAGQTPTEVVFYNTQGPETAYGFVIERRSGSRNVNLEVFAPSPASLDTFLPARSLMNLADAPDALTVAALDVVSPYPQEYYSSEGPTNGPGGTASGGFMKPDISAFANISTQSYANDTQKFNGTSAATPHVAGAAALLLSAEPNYTPDQIQAYLESEAIDIGTAGMDTAFGYGRLYLGDPAAFTNSPPVISGLPDQTTPMNWNLEPPLDLWQYSSDEQSPTEGLTYIITNTPILSAGVSLKDNRYIHINPAAGWTGNTSVHVRVSDPEGLSTTDAFSVTVAPIKTWNGSLSRDWHIADNWTPPGVPDEQFDVIIPDVIMDPAILTSSAAVDDLTIQPGAILDLTDQLLTVEGSLKNQGILKQTLVASAGITSTFLRITDLADTLTKYYGLDITPTEIISTPQGVTGELSARTPLNFDFAQIFSLITTVPISVSIYGEQICPGRFTGVQRCFEIETSIPLTASVRFYFTDSERDQLPLDALEVFRAADNGWEQTAGPYTFEDLGTANYVTAQGLSSFSLFALGREEASLLFMPLIQRNALPATASGMSPWMLESEGVPR